jgi:hypothetical protein
MATITWSFLQHKPFTMNGIEAFFLRKKLFFQLENFPTLNSSSNMKGLAMLDGVLKISQPHNSTLGTVQLCRDSIEVKMNLREHDRNRTQNLNLLIDYYENRDEDGFIISRKLETVVFIFDLRDHTHKVEFNRHSFADQFLTTDRAKEMLSETFPNSRQDIVNSVFKALKHHIVGHCDRNKILM